MTQLGLDYAWGNLAPAAVHAFGGRFVCGYLSYDTTGKNLTPAEARAFSDAGIDLVVVWETAGNRALGGRGAGIADAREAWRQAAALKMPSTRPIFFAIDFDATPGQQAAINEYFRGVGAVLGKARVGAYGGYWPVHRLFAAGLIHYGWQTYAWSGGHWEKRASLRQFSNGHTVGGVSVDYDHGLRTDFGQWRIGWVPRKRTAAKVKAAQLLKKLNQQLTGLERQEKAARARENALARQIKALRARIAKTRKQT